ncbi:hypothetical protein L4D08_26545 [Photobacterium chitinilyticum]|uniref:hypothetical protein n=1 Tax=Photobacterium chitinilyticum TaxID=2485123 RepID=UPI003D133E6B
METIAIISKAIAIIAASWAIISGVGAWKREFIGKRKIELAEDVLASFFEVKDAIASIRNPFSYQGEGKTRKRGEGESPDESELLDRGFIVFERYEAYKEVFVRFNTLKYKFMASFGPESEDVFSETNKIMNRIFFSARQLATNYWQRQGKVPMEDEEFKKHLDDMHKFEGIFWDRMDEKDVIRQELQELQAKLDDLTKPCFEEPMKTYEIFTKPLFKKG